MTQDNGNSAKSDSAIDQRIEEVVQAYPENLRQIFALAHKCNNWEKLNLPEPTDLECNNNFSHAHETAFSDSSGMNIPLVMELFLRQIRDAMAKESGDHSLTVAEVLKEALELLGDKVYKENPYEWEVPMLEQKIWKAAYDLETYENVQKIEPS